jgi:hypothetical protein
MVRLCVAVPVYAEDIPCAPADVVPRASPRWGMYFSSEGWVTSFIGMASRQKKYLMMRDYTTSGSLPR